MSDTLVSGRTGLYALGGILGCSVAYQIYKNRGLPPGPWGHPLYGVLPRLSGKLHMDALRMKEQYGDIISMYFGKKLVIILNSHKLIKQAFQKRGADFASRPCKGLVGDFFGFKDLIFFNTYTDQWVKDKKFLLSSARVFGYGQGKQAPQIEDAADRLIDTLKKEIQTSHEGIDLKPYLMWVGYNVISRILFDHMDTFDDENCQEFFRVVSSWTAKVIEVSNDFYKPFNSGKSDAFVKEARAETEAFKQLTYKYLDEHLATYDPNNIRDCIDLYIQEKGGIEDLEDFFAFILPLIPDSVHTAPLLLHWIFGFMAKHKDVQRKVQTEIDGVTGRQRQPNMGDKPDLPYTRATISEVMRLAPLFPMAFAHSAVTDTTLNGYRIPKEASIFPNLYAANRDPDVWDNPDEFDPNRFLDKDGNNNKTDGILTFSIGKRSCPAEVLSRLMFFIVFAVMMHHFEVSFAGDGPIPSTDMNDYKDGSLTGALFLLTERGQK